MKVKDNIAILAGYILVITCMCILFGALYVGIDIQKRYTANYFINHQDEFIIDTINVNGVIDHYEVRLK